MTQNYRHIDYRTSFTPSPAHTALRRLLKVVGIIIASIIGLVFYVVLKPIFRGLGWIISAVTTTAILYWILTL